jgi:hypothetical protein
MKTISEHFAYLIGLPYMVAGYVHDAENRNVSKVNRSVQS